MMNNSCVSDCQQHARSSCPRFVLVKRFVRVSAPCSLATGVKHYGAADNPRKCVYQSALYWQSGGGVYLAICISRYVDAGCRPRDEPLRNGISTSGTGRYRLRWFTPKVEVELCGHATLASAHVLWESGQLAPRQTARFYTRSGVLTATLKGAWITLDFPTRAATPIAPPAELVAALGLEPHAVVFTGRSREDYLIAIADPAILRTLQPNFTQLACLPVRGVIVTSPSDTPDYHFLSRFFAPACGVDEDPASGSAHCTLAPYWLMSSTSLR